MQVLSELQRESLTRAADKYHQDKGLVSGYLLERGLWKEDLVVGFRLGYVEKPEHGHEAFRGRLSIPYITPSGVVNIKFRCAVNHKCDGHAKYLGVPGESHLYNVGAIHTASSRIYVTEGELDAATATVAGAPAVGVSGTQKWKPHYRYMLDDFEEVVVLADGDDAGREFARFVQHEVEGSSVVYFPDGLDVTEFVFAFGEDKFRDFINARE